MLSSPVDEHLDDAAVHLLQGPCLVVKGVKAGGQRDGRGGGMTRRAHVATRDALDGGQGGGGEQLRPGRTEPGHHYPGGHGWGAGAGAWGTVVVEPIWLGACIPMSFPLRTNLP